MKKLSCLLISLFLLASLAWGAEWVNLTGSAQPPSVKLLESSDSRILLNYQLNGFERDEVIINGETFSFIGLDDESRLWVKGYPELPRLCRSVIIPDDAFMEARLVTSEYREISNIRIAPSKGHLLRSVNPDDVPYDFGEVYQMDAWYPEKVIQLRDAYILRDFRGQVVEVNAFQYNPVKRVLRVYTQLTVEIRNAGLGGANVLERSGPMTSIDPEFMRIYERHFLNFNLDRYILVEEIGPMHIITYDDFYDAVMPLVDWKNQKGLPTTIERVSVIGNNSTAIKSHIRNLYQTTGLTFVLLVGDAAQVATPSGGEDPTYAQLEGSDHYPELFVGRFSAETLGHVYTQVERSIEYEKFPQAGADWYHKGAGVASNQGPGHYGEYDDEHIDLIRRDLLMYSYTEVNQIYDPTATSGQVSAALNEGRSTINYCGHGSTTSWGTTGFNNGNVNALVNDNMLPFNTTVACLCGNFASSTCFAETWLRATNAGEPTGAIGFFASTISQSWDPPMYAQDEFIDLMCAEILHSYGALCYNGVMLMIDETGSTGNNEADHWTVFGDPSLQVRTDAPFDLNVIHANQIEFEQPTMEVTVTGVEGALAALSDQGELLGSAYSDSAGLAVIPITWGVFPPPSGSATLTVTAYNAMLYIVPIAVTTGGPDVWPPLIIHTPLTNTTSSGPYTVNATIMDYSGVASASVFYSTDGISFDEVPMVNTAGDEWSGDIPGQEVGTVIDYYIEAVDASPQSNAGTTDTYSFNILGVLFVDDMESGVGNWTHSEVAPGWMDQWHMSVENSHSPSHAWKFGDTGVGNYADHADGQLISEVITVGSESELTFWHWIDAEASGSYPDSAYDGGVVEISHNGGPWTVLPLSPGYTHAIRATAGGGNPYTGPFAPATPVFSGSSGGWIEQTADLSLYMGDIQLRFRFGSDDASNAEGWYVDDVQILGLPSGTMPDVTIELTPYGLPIQIPATGGTFEFNIAVTNNEAISQTFDAWCDITLPGGTSVSVLGPVNLTLTAGLSLDRDRFQAVPASAPAGDYSYNAYLGVSPGVVWSSDSFPFTKLSTGYGEPVSSWANWGEEFTPWLTGRTTEADAPESFTFRGQYPNPFNPVTRFSFALPEASHVTLKVYNLQGRLVATLVDGMRDAGTHEVAFDASHLASGIYLYNLTAGPFDASGKMVLIK